MSQALPHRRPAASFALSLAFVSVLGACGDRTQLPADETAAVTSPFNKQTIDANPPDSQHLEKAIGFFTSTSYPSYYLGTTSGGYIYDTVTGKRISVDHDGYHYERARTFTFPGDKYAGVIASVNGQTVWYENPANWNGGDATQPWGRQVIYGSYCHDIRLADFDGDGKTDVACSGTNTQGDTMARIVFQNSYNSWSEMVLYGSAGDGIAILDYNGRANIVGVTGTQLSWWANPGGSAARTASNWAQHYIGDGTIGTAVTTLNVGNREIVIEASNESGANNVGVWSSGLAYFDPGSNPTGAWSKVIIDSSYRDSHEVAADVLNGVPFFTTGEQSQASSACNPDGYNDHPAISGCRAEIFPWTGNGFGARTLLTNSGTQNQSLFQLNGTEYMLAANHAAFDDYDKGLYLWTFTSVTGGGTNPPPAGQPLAAGTYGFKDSAGHVWDAGWSQSVSWGNLPYIYEYSENDNTWQQFAWANGELQVVGSGKFLFNSGNTLGVGTSAGSFNIVSSGSGYTIQDKASGLYVNSNGSVSPPNKLGLSSTPTIWTVHAN